MTPEIDTRHSSSDEVKVEQTNIEHSSEASHEKDVEAGNAPLVRALGERHLQMIGIGGSIGAGLFIGSGKALSTGGPASLLLGFSVVGIMVVCNIQALGELAVTYPVNGAFYMYSVRFIDPAWGFAIGWQYAISWLITLPFEITCAGLTIQFWTSNINIGVWVAVFLGTLIVIQFFGIKGYGESEFILALIKVIACIGLIILGIIINVGGVPTDTRGYIGGRYWHDPGAFRNGFKGFVSVLVAAAFAYGGAEMAPREATQKPSPFVLAAQLAGIKALPSIINAVITLAVISVANTCSYGSTRTLQALASTGNGPKAFAYVDSKGRPVWFRQAWKLQGRNEEDIPYRSPLGVAGSVVGFGLAAIAIIATFYLAIFPINPKSRVESFFQTCMAAPIAIDWSLGVDLRHVDLDKGRRMDTFPDPADSPEILEKRSSSMMRKMFAILF
ncbi:conserved hypothetical protein [Uncinocarpus reesii 1704]|uniref:Amino acid permease/ SLC12A domain-containing protein n=1 Tax=Uncinocarpus reesii (strain UAMH 1704) TaxID=336963 RepID=C4JEJ4_UNCRE|nr:uncharacterized protein UREG_00833 [Uncinocarpus reesii 1704]EEP75986.1 conserved hypothetical protein [Uncinocarpus reesii 1704]